MWGVEGRNLEKKCIEIRGAEESYELHTFFYSNINVCAKRSVCLFSLPFFFAYPRFFISGIFFFAQSLPAQIYPTRSWPRILRYLVSTSRLSPRLTIGLLAGESTYLWLLRLDWWWRGRSGLNPVTINLWPLKTSHRLITKIDCVCE